MNGVKETEKMQVLDKGFVRLVDSMGGDDSVVRAARVSYGDGSKGAAQDVALIRYMMRHRHTSPFEHVTLTFHVKAPLFVVAQWVRHRTWSFNFLSYRYTEARDDFYTVTPEQVRAQSIANKQGSEGVVDPEIAREFARYLVFDNNYQDYAHFTDYGVAREMARMVLPQNLYTEFYATVDLHNLLHFLSLRMEGHAQWEIQQYAEALAVLTKQVAPRSYKAWEDYVFSAVTFSAQEMEIIRAMADDFDRDIGIETSWVTQEQNLSKSELAEFLGKLGVK